MKFLSTILIGFLLSGCIPKVKTSVPTVEGKVIHSITKQPIADVTISGAIKTDKNGYFLIPKKSELGIGTPMGGLWRIQRSFIVKKEGYTPLSCTCDVLNSSGYCNNVIIPLTSKDKSIKRALINVSPDVDCLPLLPKNFKR